MSYYWFNRQKILQKAKERYSKEKAVKVILENDDYYFCLLLLWKNYIPK